jgi:hypothetical protein
MIDRRFSRVCAKLKLHFNDRKLRLNMVARDVLPHMEIKQKMAPKPPLSEVLPDDATDFGEATRDRRQCTWAVTFELKSRTPRRPRRC